jgi:alpha-1,3-rhamnosyltransferase
VTFPLVSIIVPAYNHERFVAESLRSLIGQTYDNLELMLLNDGSTDRTVEHIRELVPACEKRFQRFLFVDKANEGTAATANQGISLAQGEYLFLASSDDIYEADAVRDFVPHMLNDGGVGLVCGDADFIDEWGDKSSVARGGVSFTSFVRYHTYGKPDFDVSRDFGSYKSFLSWNYIPVGLLVRRSYLEQVGCFDVRFRLEDYDAWLRMSKLCRFLFLDRVYAHYRIHPGNANTVFRERLFRDLVLIMIREADYCAQNRLTSEWRRFAEEVSHGYEQLVEAAARAKERVIRAQQARIEQQQEALEAVSSSLSWRWTEPLRWLFERVRRGR